jgi:hypothetical protein
MISTGWLAPQPTLQVCLRLDSERILRVKLRVKLRAPLRAVVRWVPRDPPTALPLAQVRPGLSSAIGDRRRSAAPWPNGSSNLLPRLRLPLRIPNRIPNRIPLRIPPEQSIRLRFSHISADGSARD